MIAHAIALILAGAATQPALAQQAAEAAPGAPEELEEIVVTGFRESLNVALAQKREAIGAVDSIVAEDIADFPDLNLAESIQRIPGVAIARDAGEGRQISVRGLSPEFTRVRLNGIEAMSANGGTDAAGGANRTRGFDFNTFASELFNSITVHKTASADIEEGSLGATVDLRTARPFDYNGFTFVVSGQGQYNDLSEEVGPRVSMVLSNTWLDGTFGALVSVAYTDRTLIDEGSSTVRWGQAKANGNFNAASAGAGGYTLDELNGAFVPRIPRYDYYEHNQDRLGITASLQLAPNDRFELNLDTAYSEFNADRTEIFLEVPNFSSAAGGMTVQDAVIDENNTMVYGVFNNVDIRSEQRYDELKTTFKQLTLDGKFEFTDRLRAIGLMGFSEASHENPIQTTLLFDWLGYNQVTYDFRGNSRLPLISFSGGDLTSDAQGVRPPSGSPTTYQSNGWYLSQVRLRPQTIDNEFQTARFSLEYDATDAIKVKGGAEYKQFTFATTEMRRSNGTTGNQEGSIPAWAAAIPISQYSNVFQLAEGFNVPSGTNTVFLIPDLDAAADLLDLYDTSVWRMGPEPALNNNRGVVEEDTGLFLQLEWDTLVFDRPLRGNVGVRYVKTDQNSHGYALVAGNYVEADRSYNDTLPSLNVAYSVTDEFTVRASAAKVMSRPPLQGINPGGTATVSGSSRAVNIGNPDLTPTEADAYDVAFEWYFAEESLLALALFYKDVGSRPTATTYTGPFTGNPFGIPDEVGVAACGTVSGCTVNADWTFNYTVNGEGGWLQGLELSYQQPFTFLPGFLSNFGTILNYTYVDSEFEYPMGTNVPPRKDQLDGLSKTSWNATLYYEVDRFSARVAAAYRDEFITRLPGQNGNSVEGTRDSLTVDASARYSVTDHLDLTLEMLNLTDEFQDQYVDASNRPVFYHHTGRNYILGARYKF